MFVVLVALSCLQGPRFSYNGSWEGHRKLPPGPNLYADNTIGTVTLKITDNRFQLTSEGVPTSGTMGSTGDHVVLHRDTVMGLPMSHAGPNGALAYPDIRVTPQPDGTLLFDDPKAIDGKPLKLSRAKP